MGRGSRSTWSFCGEMRGPRAQASRRIVACLLTLIAHQKAPAGQGDPALRVCSSMVRCAKCGVFPSADTSAAASASASKSIEAQARDMRHTQGTRASAVLFFAKRSVDAKSIETKRDRVRQREAFDIESVQDHYCNHSLPLTMKVTRFIIQRRRLQGTYTV